LPLFLNDFWQNLHWKLLISSILTFERFFKRLFSAFGICLWSIWNFLILRRAFDFLSCFSKLVLLFNDDLWLNEISGSNWACVLTCLVIEILVTNIFPQTSHSWTAFWSLSIWTVALWVPGPLKSEKHGFSIVRIYF
jgi:hypothetical protein